MRPVPDARQVALLLALGADTIESQHRLATPQWFRYEQYQGTVLLTRPFETRRRWLLICRYHHDGIDCPYKRRRIIDDLEEAAVQFVEHCWQVQHEQEALPSRY